MAKITADHLDLDPDQVLVSSTGVIGRYMPMDAVKSGIINACADLDAGHGLDAAHAIMTTDSQPKLAELEVDLGGVRVRVGGMCKGSGMIHPNMATMLAYITTDAAVEPGLMASMVKAVADKSFNQVTVDGDSSTNDTFLMLANGAAGNEPLRPGSPQADALQEALLEVARRLARSIARDGEGATKLLTVRVDGAASGDGADMAIDRLLLSIGGLTVFERGAGVTVDLGAVRAAFEQPEIEIVATLGMGEAASEAWGCDLSEEYVRINADYTT